MSSFVLKIIALITMLIDHSGYLILNRFSFMNYIGRLSFPIFALISQVPYMLLFSGTLTLNILFTLALGLFSITIYNKLTNKLLGILFVIFSAVIAQLLHLDYGWFGIITIFFFYVFKNKKVYMNIFFPFITFINYICYFAKTSRIEYLLIILFCTLSLIPINLYNGKKGKNIKYLLYLFYPLHLILLYLIKLI